jgi:small-conductance mechanosensitive channel
MQRGFLATVLACLFLGLVATAGRAQAPAPAPEKIAELVKIISDPQVKAWLEAQQKTAPATPMVAPQANDLREMGFDLRNRFRALLAALPRAPGEIGSVFSRVLAESLDTGLPPPTFIIIGIVLVALGGEWLARRFFPFSQLGAFPILVQAARQVAPLIAFAVIAAIVFFSVNWPPAFDTVIVHFLLGAIVFRVALAVYAMARAAGSMERRLYQRVVAFTAVLIFGMACLGIGTAFKVDHDVIRLLAVFFSLILLAISIETVLRDPGPQPARIRLFKVFGLLVLWTVWVSGFLLLFWVLLYAGVLPRLLPAVDRVARAFAATRWPGDVDSSIPTVLLVKGVRALVIGLALASLYVVWKNDPAAIGRANGFLDSIVAGLLKSAIVILVADLGWAVARAAIGRKLLSVAGDEHDTGAEAARRARVRTLLPIFQNALAATLLVVTALMVFAELGIEIAPLIAGAGVVGMAIGFGSQTLVKDVISGVFYLMDDAFRVGEYIQSGSYMGTVEGFSLRSVRLRHHRGPIFTVPFGALGAVQNMSRDWVIDKFRLRVNFDTDIAKAKKLTKVIGAELQADEELGPLIIQTVKMKGVEQISDYGIELSFAFTAKPGNQSMIRRRAYAMIRKVFAENGIGFAQPTVQVGGDDKGGAAAAHLVQMQKAQAEAEALAMQKQA